MIDGTRIHICDFLESKAFASDATGHGMKVSGNGTARWRWPRMVFCLLFALSMLLGMGQSISAQVQATGIQVASASDQADPCEDGHGAAGRHCHLAAAACPFCAPVEATAVVFDRASAPESVLTEQIVTGTVTTPLFRPPKLLLPV